MKIIVIKIVIIVKIIIAITTNKIKLKILGGLIQLIIQKKFTIADGNFERELFGNFDENVKLIEKTLNIDVILREGNIILIGEEKNVDSALKLMNELHQTVSNGKHLDKQSISYSLSLLLEGSEQKIKELEGTIVITQRGKAVQPKTLGQKEYIKLIENNDITFGVGPAGTGKTYLAVAMAVKAFKRDEVSRIILTRPAVEAGESLGFLPGDLKDKVDPYLRPYMMPYLKCWVLINLISI